MLWGYEILLQRRPRCCHHPTYARHVAIEFYGFYAFINHFVYDSAVICICHRHREHHKRWAVWRCKSWYRGRSSSGGSGYAWIRIPYCKVQKQGEDGRRSG